MVMRKTGWLEPSTSPLCNQGGIWKDLVHVTGSLPQDHRAPVLASQNSHLSYLLAYVRRSLFQQLPTAHRLAVCPRVRREPDKGYQMENSSLILKLPQQGGKRSRPELPAHATCQSSLKGVCGGVFKSQAAVFSWGTYKIAEIKMGAPVCKAKMPDLVVPL